MEPLDKCARVFIATTAVILFLSGGLKAVDVFRAPKYTQKPEPVFSYAFGSEALSMRYAIASTALVEAAVLAAMLFPIAQSWKLRLIACLSLSFMAYRVSFWLSGTREFCPCLGSLGDWLNIGPSILPGVASGLFLYMMTGSVVLLVWSNLQRRNIGSAVASSPEVAN